MFLPIYDGLPLRCLRAPLATRGLLGACVAAFAVVESGFLAVDPAFIVAGFGLIPAVLWESAVLPKGLPFVPEPLTLVTSVFLHSSVLHLLGNMLFLWVFGDNVEDAMGHGRFLLFFALCGAAAGLTHALVDPQGERPLIGASGAVAGVVAAYLVLYPRVRLWGLFLSSIPLRVPASWAIGFWIAVQVVSALFAGDEGVGWFAHLGGLAAGGLLVPIFRRRYDPVLARAEKAGIRPAT